MIEGDRLASYGEVAEKRTLCEGEDPLLARWFANKPQFT